MPAQVTMSLGEWQEHMDARKLAENKIAELTQEIVELKTGGESSVVRSLLDGFAAAHQLVSFLIAHANPEIVKVPWPWESLVTFANALEALPTAERDRMANVEAAIDMRDLAEDAKRWNTLRAERAYRLATGGDPGPDVGAVQVNSEATVTASANP